MAAKKKVLNEQQKLFLDALVGEAKGNFAEAKRIAGYSPSYKNSDIIEAISDEIIVAARNVLAQNSVKASLGLVDVLESPAVMGAKEKMAAAEKILDRVGVVKKEQVEVSTNGTAIILLPPKKDREED